MDYYKEFTKAKIMLAEDEANAMNPEIHVDGLGSYDLKTLKDSTRRNIQEIINLVTVTDQPRAWRNVKQLLDGGVIQAKVDAIVAAHDDLQAKRRKGGPSSRGIDKE